MRGYVTDWRGREWLLPYPTQWELEYTAGVPCDSFTFRCPWEMGGETAPGDWVRFSARYQGKDMFNGVVDECQVTPGRLPAGDQRPGAGGPAAGQRGHWAGLRHRHPGGHPPGPCDALRHPDRSRGGAARCNPLLRGHRKQ